MKKTFFYITIFLVLVLSCCAVRIETPPQELPTAETRQNNVNGANATDTSGLPIVENNPQNPIGNLPGASASAIFPLTQVSSGLGLTISLTDISPATCDTAPCLQAALTITNNTTQFNNFDYRIVSVTSKDGTPHSTSLPMTCPNRVIASPLYGNQTISGVECFESSVDPNNISKLVIEFDSNPFDTSNPTEAIEFVLAETLLPLSPANSNNKSTPLAKFENGITLYFGSAIQEKSCTGNTKCWNIFFRVKNEGAKPASLFLGTITLTDEIGKEFKIGPATCEINQTPKKLNPGEEQTMNVCFSHSVPASSEYQLILVGYTDWLEKGTNAASQQVFVSLSPSQIIPA